MTEQRTVKVEIRELNIALPQEEEFFVRERPIETVARKLEELKLSPERVAEILDADLQVVKDSLAEEIYCPEDLLLHMLNLVGYELVAIKDQIEWRAQDGHHYYGERCVYCGSNMYDVGMYGPPECASSPA
jgi:hypothetical protein